MEHTSLQQRPFEVSPESERAHAEVLSGFEGKPKELIPMLQKVQRTFGYLPEKWLLEISSLTGVPTATVFGVASFYAQFRFQPVGKHIVRLCRGTACHVRGSVRILKDIQNQFAVGPGETTKDGLFTVETVACFGSCALAPVMVVGDSVYGRLNPSKARKIIEDLRGKSEVPRADEKLAAMPQE
jgi:NADH-quinone oxidoreductase subunit E